ncbi:hypothetical protein D3C87_2039980 [compost metagenome]
MREAISSSGMNGMTSPMTRVLRPAKARAPAFGWYVSCSIAASTFLRVFSEIGRLPLST